MDINYVLKALQQNLTVRRKCWVSLGLYLRLILTACGEDVIIVDKDGIYTKWTWEYDDLIANDWEVLS